MKKLNCNNLFGNGSSVFISITDNLTLADGDNLYYNFIFTILRGPARFYHRLENRLYSTLDKVNK